MEKVKEVVSAYIRVKTSDNHYRMAGVELPTFSEENAKDLAHAFSLMDDIINKECGQDDKIFVGWTTTSNI